MERGGLNTRLRTRLHTLRIGCAQAPRKLHRDGRPSGDSVSHSTEAGRSKTKRKNNPPTMSNPASHRSLRLHPVWKKLFIVINSRRMKHANRRGVADFRHAWRERCVARAK